MYRKNWVISRLMVQHLIRRVMLLSGAFTKFAPNSDRTSLISPYDILEEIIA